jgi:para-nitrobenzyl esterase
MIDPHTYVESLRLQAAPRHAPASFLFHYARCGFVRSTDFTQSIATVITQHPNQTQRKGDAMSNSDHRMLLNRREAMLLSATAGMGLAMSRSAHASDSVKTGVHQQEPGTCSTPRTAVANTQYGKVRGYIDGGVFTFKGVPYGQNTAGENRWLPAKAPTPWKDEYPALIYGANCMQNLHDWNSQEQVFLQDWDDGYQSEDMLKLNIWTPSLTGKRPVMFYIHGGGFEFGSSYELPSHEGAQMARHHDVVQISVNHRLNGLGFLDVSEIGGPAFADSVNVGMTDLVAALKWVQENVANFGGDPDNVMIYGQSGGGGKVATLLGMPSAKGLFHRAAIQSGGGGAGDPAEAKEFSRQLVKVLGIGPNDISALQKMEWHALMDACNAAQAKMPKRAGMFSMPGPARRFWMPILDGHIINVRAFQNEAPEISKDVPMMIGSVSEEGNTMASRPTEAEWRAGLVKVYGEAKGAALADAMKKAHPEKSVRTLSYMCGGGGILNGVSIRNSVVSMAKLKHDLHAAPVYTYYFCWQSPMLEGAGAWHTADLAFCFDNTKRCEQATGNTPEAQALAKKMATAWANFARTGNPSQPGLAWTPSDPEHNQTMVWDNNPRMVNDPEGEIRKIIL